jgi:zinc transporter ZupT
LVYFGIFSVVELKLQLIYKIILAIFILAIPLFSGFKLDYIMAFISSVLIWVYTLKIVPQLHDIENESNLLVSINNKLDLLLEKNGKQPLK